MTRAQIIALCVSLTVTSFYALCITPLAYAEARRQVIEWAMDQPEMDAFVADRLTVHASELELPKEGAK